MLAAPSAVAILHALEDAPKRQTELRRESGLPAQSTLRSQLKALADIGALDKRRRDRFPGLLDYALAPSGRELITVAENLEYWLARAPEGPLSLGSGASRAAVKALAEGWSTTMLRALAAGPLSLTELDRLIGALSYPSIERRLSAMRVAGLIEAQPSRGRRTPYGVTKWLRLGIGPMAAACHWERRHLPDAAPRLGGGDIETIFLLALPLLTLPDELSGSCRLAAEVADGGRSRLVGAQVEVRCGAVVSCTTRLDGSQDAWALGPPPRWLDALAGFDDEGLEIGGDSGLARSLVAGLNRSLFKQEISGRT